MEQLKQLSATKTRRLPRELIYEVIKCTRLPKWLTVSNVSVIVDFYVMELVRKKKQTQIIMSSNLFEKKMQDLTEEGELEKVESLTLIEREVKTLLTTIAEKNSDLSDYEILDEISAEFGKLGDDKLRAYLSVQRHILQLCQEVNSYSVSGGTSGRQNVSSNPSDSDGPDPKRKKAGQNSGASSDSGHQAMAPVSVPGPSPAIGSGHQSVAPVSVPGPSAAIGSGQVIAPVQPLAAVYTPPPILTQQPDPSNEVIDFLYSIEVRTPPSNNPPHLEEEEQ